MCSFLSAILNLTFLETLISCNESPTVTLITKLDHLVCISCIFYSKKCTNSVVIKNKNFTKFEPPFFFKSKNFEILFADSERVGLFALEIIYCILKSMNSTPFTCQKPIGTKIVDWEEMG